MTEKGVGCNPKTMWWKECVMLEDSAKWCKWPLKLMLPREMQTIVKLVRKFVTMHAFFSGQKSLLHTMLQDSGGRRIRHHHNFRGNFRSKKIRPWQAKRTHEGEPTPVLDTIEQYVDQYLKSAGYAMTSSEFFEWKKMIDDQNKREDMERKKGKIYNLSSNGKLDRRKLVENTQRKELLGKHLRSCKIYHQTCKIYQRVIAMVNNYGRSWRTNDVWQWQLITIETKV